MKGLSLIVAFLLCSAPGFTQVKHTVTKSAVTYQIKNMGFNSTGTFGGLQANISFDKAHPETSSIEASIDATSINSDNAMRDHHLKSDDFFDVAKYPRITMKSVSIKQKNGNNYVGMFNLTIKDKTKETTVPFTYTETGNQGKFDGAFTIKRADFGLGGKSITLADEAKIMVSIQTTF